MRMRITCRCGHHFEAETGLAGPAVKCPQCGGPLNAVQPEDPDAMYGFADERATKESKPPDVCPSCQAAMPPGAILCVSCGYNLKLGRKMETQVEPVGRPPTYPVSARRPTKATPRGNGLRLVATGLNLVLWGKLLICVPLLLTLILPALPWLSIVFLPIIVFLPLAIVVGPLLEIVGPILCLNVPQELQAKRLILVAVLIELGSVLTNSAPQFFGWPRIFNTIGTVLLVVGYVLFLFFLKRLGNYLGRSELANDAQWLITVGSIFAVLCVPIVLIPTLTLQGILDPSYLRWLVRVAVVFHKISGLLLVCVLLFWLYLLIEYIGLLYNLRQEILSRTPR